MHGGSEGGEAEGAQRAAKATALTALGQEGANRELSGVSEGSKSDCPNSLGKEELTVS